MAEHIPSFSFPTFQAATIDIITKFLSENGDNPELFNKEDVQLTQLNMRVERIRRIPFLTMTDDDIYNALVKSLKWRRTTRVNELTESDIPREYFRLGGLFQYGKDMKGSTLLVFRVRMHEQYIFHPWLETLKKYVLFLFERIEKSLANEDRGGLTLLFDCQEAVLENFNLKLMTFIMKTLFHHYPGMLASVIVYKIHETFDWVVDAVKEQIPKKLEFVIDVVKTFEGLLRFVNVEELPDFMGGSNRLPYRSSPENAPVIRDYAKKHNLAVEAYLTHLKQFL